MRHLPTRPDIHVVHLQDEDVLQNQRLVTLSLATVQSCNAPRCATCNTQPVQLLLARNTIATLLLSPFPQRSLKSQKQLIKAIATEYVTTIAQAPDAAAEAEQNGGDEAAAGGSGKGKEEKNGSDEGAAGGSGEAAEKQEGDEAAAAGAAPAAAADDQSADAAEAAAATGSAGAEEAAADAGKGDDQEAVVADLKPSEAKDTPAAAADSTADAPAAAKDAAPQPAEAQGTAAAAAAASAKE